MNIDESILNKVTRILNESDFKVGPMDGDAGLDHPSTSLHQTCECSIYTMNIFLSNLAMRTYPDPETPIFQIKTKLNTVGHFDFDAKAVTRWMRSIDPNMGSDVYSAPLKQFGGRFGVLDDLYTVGEDDGLEAKLGYGLQLTFHVDKSDQGYGISARIEKVFSDDNNDGEMVEESKEYDDFFKAAMKKFGITSPDELSGEKQKEFFDYVDKNWKADHEEEIDEAYPVSGSFHRYMAGGKSPGQDYKYQSKWSKKAHDLAYEFRKIHPNAKVENPALLDAAEKAIKQGGYSSSEPGNQSASALLLMRTFLKKQGVRGMIEAHRHNLNKREEFTVVVTKNNKVVDQLSGVLGSEVDAAIDLYKEMHGKDAKVSIENKSGKIVYTESTELKEENIGVYTHSGNGDKWVLERRSDGVYYSFHKGGKEKTSGGFFGKVSNDEAHNMLSKKINRMGSSYAIKTSLQEALTVPHSKPVSF